MTDKERDDPCETCPLRLIAARMNHRWHDASDCPHKCDWKHTETSKGKDYVGNHK